MHYLDYIKPITDKRPYLKKILKFIWIKAYRIQLKLNSIYSGADLNKTYWINPERILFSQLRSESSKRLYKSKVKKTFKFGRTTCNIVKIEDTGSGISEENLSKIFNPFFSTKEKGSGLGVSIVRNIIEGHRGTIRIESQEGSGTTVTIRLPKG